MPRLASRLLLLLVSSAAAALMVSCGVTAIPAESGGTGGGAPSPAKATPVITWSPPAAITNPTPLSAAQLDATADVAGTFVYSPAAGTVLAAGAQMLTTTFTPNDTADYNTATDEVTLVVNGAVNSSSSNLHLAIADFEDSRVLLYKAPFSTGENASVALGQPDFSNRNAPVIPAANTLAYPAGVTVDSSGNLWVADSWDCRVLEFQPPFTNGMDASLVIGQPTLETVTSQHYACAIFNTPVAVAFDSHGNLWVDDGWASLISEFTPPFTTGMQPTLTIGQVSPCDIGYKNYVPPYASATTLCGPDAIAFDAKGDLWVSDSADLRVLEFAPPFSSGMAASLELGQPPATAFTSNAPQPPSATSFCAPQGLSFDSSGNLWVADCDRVLEFVPPFSNDMAASLVLGQPNFTQGLNEAPVPPAANTLAGPVGLWFESNGNLMVSDSGNGRVLIFTPPFHNDMDATTVIGLPSMTSAGNACLNDQPPGANTLCLPEGGVAF